MLVATNLIDIDILLVIRCNDDAVRCLRSEGSQF